MHDTPPMDAGSLREENLMALQAGNQLGQEPDVPTQSAAGEHELPLLLRVEAAADRLSLSRSMMWTLVSSGSIRSIHIGRARRIIAADLVRWVAEQEAEGTLPTGNSQT